MDKDEDGRFIVKLLDKNKIDDLKLRLNELDQTDIVSLNKMIDLHFYLKDVKQILTTFTSQEINLSNTECGETIEQVEANLKSHEAFQKHYGSVPEAFLKHSRSNFVLWEI